MICGTRGWRGMVVCPDQLTCRPTRHTHAWISDAHRTSGLSCFPLMLCPMVRHGKPLSVAHLWTKSCRPLNEAMPIASSLMAACMASPDIRRNFWLNRNRRRHSADARVVISQDTLASRVSTLAQPSLATWLSKSNENCGLDPSNLFAQRRIAAAQTTVGDHCWPVRPSG